jgi:hypothetical protein
MVCFDELPQPFVRSDVVAAGLSVRAVSRAVASGTLVRVASRLYAVRSSWETRSAWEQHRLKAEAAVRLTKDAIVSHSSAAALLGLPHPTHPPQHVSMTVLDDLRTSRSDTWRRFHRGATPYGHVRISAGVPEFAVARTVIDCARELHPRDALAIADGALRAGLVTRKELWTMRSHQRRWPGVAGSNDVLLLADGRRENWLESASAWASHRWGLPIGTPQVDILSPGGRHIGRCDVLWSPEGVVGEADGVAKYLEDGTSEQAVGRRLIAEEVRQRGFTDLGLAVVRWTPHEAMDGGEIHTRFQRAAASSRSVNATLRCSCCGRGLGECAVEAELGGWRRMIADEFARKIW